MNGSAGCSPAHLAATRAGLRRVAEHVLTSTLYAATGEIAIVPSPGGFRTPPFGADGRFLTVDGAELVPGGDAGTRRTALTTVRAAAEIPGDGPSAAWLWPEHFDLGITAQAINYGASPGDARFTDPYIYVGPHDGAPLGEPEFWNAPFGTVRTFHQIGTAEEAAAFSRDGRAGVLAHARTSSTRRKQ